ncbi:helix-turn-helix transcriptional regulator [Streptomyces xiaopingdaonensis]|uniref:helix-turn-helix transcriptional regulator n=1 Tax=Streptomyces xiaopingdaonensis TaxID=1565415 RepID=UPI0003095393|nr:AraC family transcriptional regulator [Streptomyces xiaopingdaonensis]
MVHRTGSNARPRTAFPAETTHPPCTDPDPAAEASAPRPPAAPAERGGEPAAHPPPEPWQRTVPLHRLAVPSLALLPFAIGSFDSIGPLSRAPFPHRHTFHELILLTAGEGTHLVDLRPARLAPPQLHVIAPGQVHSWAQAHDLDGKVVLFEDAFLLAHPGDGELLALLARSGPLRLDEESAEQTSTLLTAMEDEYTGARPGALSVLQAYLHILLVRLRRLAPSAPAQSRCSGPSKRPGEPADSAKPPPERRRTPRTTSPAERFTTQLARPGAAAAERSVTAWAAKLGVSVGHLNACVREATGRTPGQLLRQAQTLEAKRLLTSTDLTVARVAHEVGFSDAAYFCRFFRRETGTTPGEFRRAAGGIHHSGRTPSIDAQPDCP